LLSKRSSEGILVGDVGSDVLLDTELSCLVFGDKPFFKLSCEDSLGGTKVIVVDISHGRDEVICEQCRGSGGRENERLACVSPAYMHFCSGVLIFKLPYRLACMYIILIDPLIV